MTESTDSPPLREPSSPATSEPNAGVPRQPFTPEVIGGRFFTGVVLLALIGVVSWQWLNGWVDRILHPKEPRPVATWQVGGEADVELTLITADAKRLACAHDATVDDTHCGYTANKRPWRRTPNSPLDDNDEHVIQPYRTADTNALILVSGLWAEPELALRLHREPPNLADVNKHLRFVAYCHVRFIGEMEKLSTRWDTGAKWGDDPKALVAKPVSCTLQPPNG